MIKKLLPYLRDYKKESLLGPLCKLLEACFELIVPMIMSSMIDIGIAQNDTAYILKMGGILVLLGVLGLASALTAQYFAAKAAYGFGTALRRDLFAHCNRLSFTELDRLGTAGLITRITGDVQQVQSGVNMLLRLFMRSPFLVIGAWIMAFRINTQIALIFAVAILILSLVIYQIMTAGMPIYKKAQKQLDRLSLFTRENLLGVRVIRAFSQQSAEKKDFTEASLLMRRFQLTAGRISSLMNPLTYVLVNLAIILIIRQGAVLTDTGVITQGQVIALVNYMTQILLALVVLAQLIITLTRAAASAVRICDVFAVSPSLSDRGNLPQTPIADAPKVSFENVSFSYAGAQEAALCDINLTVAPGETIGIIGGTGAGKSTLVHLMPRFYDADRGSIRIDGIDVRRYPFSELRQKISMVPQKAVLFRGTIRENMQWRKQDATDEEILQALEIAQAKDLAMEKDGGLDAMVSQGGANFSGGQRQRLTIARALVGAPEILVLDDSASALDYATDARLRKALSDRLGDTTVFLISQRAATLMNADRILVLDDGKPVGLGKHQELFASCAVYREICLSQFSKEEAEKA